MTHQGEMTVDGVRALLCSCEGGMPLDGEALAAALNPALNPALAAAAPPRIFRHLCRTELAAFRAAAAAGGPFLVACAQEAPLFTELAEAAGAPTPLVVDIRDRAGWSSQAAAATPKIAALIAEALVPQAQPPAESLTSAGQILILGEDQTALAAAARLGAERGVVCLLTSVAADMTPPFARPFAVLRGRLGQVSGALGGFTADVEASAGLAASARDAMRFDPPGPPRQLRADVILDLRRGAPPLWAARDGYLRCDPNSPAALEKALAEALSLLGAFEKPRYVRFRAELCAHARNHVVACARCIDVCPAAAITPDGDRVKVDAAICAGHGACASACPTGAISYDLPAGNGLYQRLRVLLKTYAAAGGTDPTLLIYEQGAGDETLSALARFGDGLPAAALPFAVNAPAALGPEFLLTAYAYGAARVVALAPPTRDRDLGPLREAAAVADAVLTGLGWGGSRTAVLVTADPDELAAALAGEIGGAPGIASLGPASLGPAAAYLALGDKRSTLALALAHLRRIAPRPIDEFPLPAGAPIGGVAVDGDKCTLCMACAAVCPTGALSGAPDAPSLGFTESACVQCGLCRAVCPEKAAALTPRFNAAPSALERVILKQEAPHCCPRCGKAFATKSAIAMLLDKLAGHPMFADRERLELITMCEDCRGAAQFAPPRRTS